MIVNGLAHVCLSSTDLAETERFYCSALGLSRAFDFTRQGETVGFYLELNPGSYIEVFRRDDVRADADSPIQHLCLEVDDIEQVAAALQASGYEVTEPKLGADRSWQAWTTDPDGVRIEFHQYTPESSQMTGRDCPLD